jgi:hypothetical protein
MHFSKKLYKGIRARLAFFFLPCLVQLTGCRRAPSIGLYGSYFPGWLVCIAVALVLTMVIRFLLHRYNFEEHLRPLGLVYISLGITLTCLLWLIFFF